MKTIQEASFDELQNFTNIVEPLIEFITINWDVKAEPKGYQEYLKSYEEYDTLPELPFSGLYNTSSICNSFPDAMNKCNIAYDDTQQGRDPLRMLISNLVSYGISIGVERQKKKEANNNMIHNVQDLLSDIINDSLSKEIVIKRSERTLSSLKRLTNL